MLLACRSETLEIPSLPRDDGDVSSQLQWLLFELLKDIVDEAVHDPHSLAQNPNIGVNLFENLEKVDLISPDTLLDLLLLLLLQIAIAFLWDLLLGLRRSFLCCHWLLLCLCGCHLFLRERFGMWKSLLWKICDEEVGGFGRVYIGRQSRFLLEDRVCVWAGFVLSNQVLLQYSFMIFLYLISGFVWFFWICALVCSAILGFWIPSFLFVFVFLNLSLCLVLGLFLCSYCF